MILESRQALPNCCNNAFNKLKITKLAFIGHAQPHQYQLLGWNNRYVLSFKAFCYKRILWKIFVVFIYLANTALRTRHPNLQSGGSSRSSAQTRASSWVLEWF
ncbi:MAG: hypothetical protein ACK41E_00215 [Deinococcales bacterium]